MSFRSFKIQCFFLTVLTLGFVELEIEVRDVKSFFTREVCLGELGCFSAGPPFFHILERPLSLLPDSREDINTQFHLYTRQYSDHPTILSNLDNSIQDLPKSGFNPHVPTKFVVPGFVSHTDPHWKKPIIDALLFYENCNLFYINWSAADGPLYEQAVANTRVVGAELALFIQKLQAKTGLTSESVHVIGHSLGAHIGGYAGKRMKNLGRITGLDPAGPYFTSVEPEVRLYRTDALFVDAIHTNAASSRFQGFGLTESIAHFDFYPNGGHLQPGCKDFGQGIMSFLQHPTLDYDGLRDLMCSHSLAIDMFVSSIEHGGECALTGTSCDQWDSYVHNHCGNCIHDRTLGGILCVPMGIHAVEFAKCADSSKSIDFFLNTTAKEPFCL